jgi:hypothetical protein
MIDTTRTTTLVPDSLVRDRLASSASLRTTAWQLAEIVGHVHAAVTGAVTARSAAAMHVQFPAFEALLLDRLATRPVAAVRALDASLLELVRDGGDQPLDAWVGRAAAALAAA